MTHNIEKKNGAYRMVSTGEAWHYAETGHPILTHANSPEDFEQWAELSGLGELMEKTPAYQQVMLPGDSGELEAHYVEVEDSYWVRRVSDQRCFTVVTDQYEIFQPRECIEFLREFVKADERFQLNTAGTLKNGAMVWANFGFAHDIKVVDDNHKLNLFCTTTFDGTGATKAEGRIVRPVCENTVRAGEFGAKGVSIGHRTKITESVRKQAYAQLEEVLMQAKTYQAMGEAFAQIRISKDEAEKFLHSLLFTAKQVEQEVELANGKKSLAKVWTQPSTRTANLIEKLQGSLDKTIGEGTEQGTAWTVFNAITRFADHEMGIRKTDGKDEVTARMESATFGAASAFKSKAISELIKRAELNMKDIRATAQSLELVAA